MNFLVSTSHAQCATCNILAQRALAAAMFVGPIGGDKFTDDTEKDGMTHCVEVLRDPNGIGKSYVEASRVNHPSVARPLATRAEQIEVQERASRDGATVYQFPLQRHDDID